MIRRSYYEGLMYALMVGCTESFALYHAATTGIALSKIAILSTVPALLGSVCQWLLPRWIDARNLRAFKLLFYFIQALGLAMLAYSTQVQNPYLLMLFSLCLYWIGGMASGPLWLEWMRKAVPSLCMANFLSKRNGVVALATLCCYLTTALFLQRSTGSQAFLIAFSVGALSRLAALGTQFWLTREALEWPREKRLSADPVNLSGDFRKAVIWVVALTSAFKFSVATASPFFLPYMTRDLGFGVMTYVILTSIPFLGRFLFMSGWGRASTDMRPFIGMQVACAGIALLPAMWIWFPSFSTLMLLELCSGLLWGGFELCSVLILQRFSGPGAVLKWIAFHQATMNICAVIGALLGSYLLENNFNYQQVFYLSSGLRMIVVIVLIVALRRQPATSSRFRVYRTYLNTVLSLRPSMANVGRVLSAGRPRKRNSI